MKIGCRNGHNVNAVGAIGIVSEVVEDTKIFQASKTYLEKYNTIVDCSNEIADVDTELMYGINKANANNVDLFYSVHLNKAYDNYNGSIGAEIWVHPCASQDTKYKANAILKNLNKLGFINRGIKYSDGLAELNSTNMEAMIIECFFCEATGDVELYKKHGADKIGLAIANGIDSRVKNNKEVYDMKTIVLYFGDMDANAAIYVAQKNQCPMMKKSDFDISGLKAEKIIQIGGRPGSTRYDSLKDAGKLV